MIKKIPVTYFFRDPGKLFFLVLPVLCQSSFFGFAQTYFQQDVAYTIHVTLNDRKHELSAFEELNYTNNSTTSLKKLYFHLWPNAYRDELTVLGKEFYKDGDSRMMDASQKDFGFIDSLDFQVDGQSVTWSLLPDTADVCLIELNKTLLPGQSIHITTPFHIKIPSASISRLGHFGQAYYITQWYPKPAVFDKNGWNYFPYADQSEYYSEFGSFDVFITLPENYVVGGTGELVNGEKELQWLTQRAQETDSLKSFSDDMTFPKSSETFKTLHYHQEKVHDFAWFADKRWHVLKSEVESPLSGKKITTWMMFTNVEAGLWLKAPGYLREAIRFYTLLTGEYPYNQLTAVDVTKAAGNGMEYPNIIAIGNYGSEFDLDVTIAHETGHNWFYGVLGSNERRHPWMDEGINNFFETRYVYTKYPVDSADKQGVHGKFFSTGIYSRIVPSNHRSYQYWSYVKAARRNSDQPPDLSSEKFSNDNYHTNVYHKSSIAFDYLKSYLGDSLFDTCMRRYYEEWKFRHPMPEDFKKCFEESSGKNLSWFFDDLLFSTRKLDLAIISLHKASTGDSSFLSIKNKASIKGPFAVSSMKGDRVLATRWVEGFRGEKTISMKCEGCDGFRIDPQERMPELYRNNNYIRSQGMLKRVKKIRFRFLAGQEDPVHSDVFYSPVAGWNMYNGLMAGMAFHNIFTAEKKVEYTVMPLFAFRTNDLNGGGTLRYHIYPKETSIQKITLHSGISSYAYADDQYPDEDPVYKSTLHFLRLDNRIEFTLRSKDPREKLTKRITLRHIFIRRDLAYGLKYRPYTNDYNYFQAEYMNENTNPFYAYSQRWNFTVNKDFLKVFLETNNFLSYSNSDKGFKIRCYAGFTSIRDQISPGVDYNQRMSGYGTSDSYKIPEDYLFDEVFLGRTETTGVLSQQFVVADAGFKIPTLFFRKADRWMVGINLSTTLPGVLPFRLFADFGTYNGADTVYNEAKLISFEAGVELPVIKDIFTIYFPISWSSDIQYIIDYKNLHYGNLVRFELHLKKLNPLNLIRNTEY